MKMTFKKSIQIQLGVKIILLILVNTLILTFKANAQTTADSVLTITDTSVITNTNVIIKDTIGHTTLFAGGQYSNYRGLVGVGTQTPSVKLHIFDDNNVNFRITQTFHTDSLNRINLNGKGNTNRNQSGILGNNGDPLDNFEISFTSEESNDGLFRQGTVFMSTFSNYDQLNINNSTTSQRFLNSVSTAQQASPCSIYGLGSPALVQNATGFGWQTPNCNTAGSYVTSMYLSPFGSLHLESGIFANGFSQIVAGPVGAALLIKNNNSQGMGLKIAAGDGANASADYSIFEADDFAGNKIVEINGKDQILYAREIKVQTTAFPDFVFSKDYCMMGLHELEDYINTNHHLPEILSAEQAETGGVKVSEMQNKLLQKIEELTLIVIEQNKRIEELEKQEKH